MLELDLVFGVSLAILRRSLLDVATTLSKPGCGSLKPKLSKCARALSDAELYLYLVKKMKWNLSPQYKRVQSFIKCRSSEQAPQSTTKAAVQSHLKHRSLCAWCRTSWTTSRTVEHHILEDSKRLRPPCATRCRAAGPQGMCTVRASSW